MQTRALKTLLEIDKVGSFATAASRLNMTLSAVSMQMKALETELGAALFDRAFRPPRLTPLGRSVCHQAQRLLSAEYELRAVCAPSDRLNGRYRIGFVPTASVRMLPPFLLKAQRWEPSATFHIVTGLSEALEAKVQDGDLDFAVVTASPRREPALSSWPLRQERLAFAAPSQPDECVPSALVEHIPFLHFMPSSGIGKLIWQRMESCVGAGRGHLVLDSVEAIMECVNRGVGFTLLPEPDIRRYASAQTRIFPPEPPGLSRRLILIGPAASRHQGQAERVRELFAS